MKKLQLFSRDTLNEVFDKLNCTLREKHPNVHRAAKKCKTAILPPAMRFPSSILIEILNVCNLNCRMCPQHSKNPDVASPRKKGLMDFELYKKIIDDIPQKNTFVSTIGAGEPLLHPKIAEMLKYAKKKGNNLHIITNAELLVPEMSEKLLDAGLDVIGISIDGSTKSTHESIRVGSNFDRVVKNIEQFLKIKAQRNSRLPSVRIMMVELDENKDEVNEVIDRWLPLVDEVHISTYRVNSGRNFCSASGSVRRTACLRLWQTMVIGWDGRVGLCCDDWAGEVILGDVKTSGIKDIWFSKKFQEIRRYHLKGTYEKVPICLNCDSWMEGIPFVTTEENGHILKKNPFLRVYSRPA